MKKYVVIFFGGGLHGDQDGLGPSEQQIILGRVKHLLIDQDPYNREMIWKWMWVANIDERVASVIDIASYLGITVIERPVDKTELFVADEVFLTGTAAKITPIKRIESTELVSNRPIMNKLKEILISITENKNPRYAHWITKVDLFE